MMTPPPTRDRRSLGEIETWLFDLDNTLYPASCRLFDQIHVRMTEFVANLVGVGLDEARRLQKEHFRQHGTTLRGLMNVHGIDPRPFLDYVHDIDLSGIPPNLALGAALAALPGRKIVFTNGSVRHAERVLAQLGIDEHFPEIFDVEAASWVPKPDPATYEIVVKRFGFDPTRAAMVEDMAKNLVPAAAMGMMTVWVRDAGAADWATEGAHGPHIDYVVDDLTAFLIAAGAAHEQREEEKP
jgi:putative hydrolase of the HAD superfamily